jgi:catechol 2,3-dioxygenase-like lactoylglutathione lyase family enzyme
VTVVDLYLDHVLIGVRDLERAGRIYADLLGFTVTPEGVHPGRGTHNQLIVFGPEYLELIAVRDPREARRDRPEMLEFLERRQGLYMFALGSHDLEATVAELHRRGGGVSDPVDGARAGAGDRGGYTWRSANLDQADTPGSATFIIQHHHTIQQRYTEPANPTVHANGVTGIFSLTLAVKDAPSAAAAWCRTLGLAMGEPVEDEANCLCSVRVGLGHSHLEFVSPRGDGPLARYLEANGESPYSLCLRVTDLGRTTAQLTGRGLSLGPLKESQDGPSRALSEDQTEWVNLKLVQQGQ